MVAGTATVGINGHTPATLASALGVEATSLSAVYSDGSGSAPTTRSRSTPRPPPRSPTPSRPATPRCASLAPDETPILWPEHFDIGISVDEVNYGVSAGDSYLAVPYAYVGPWSPPAQDDYWNAPFGRALPVDEIDDLLAFFTEGRDRVGSA